MTAAEQVVEIAGETRAAPVFEYCGKVRSCLTIEETEFLKLFPTQVRESMIGGIQQLL